MSNLLPITVLILLPLLTAQEVFQISHSANMILKSKSKPIRHLFKSDLVAYSCSGQLQHPDYLERR